MTNRNVTVSRIADPAEIRAERAYWNALADGVPFRRWEWLGAWWNHYAGDSQLYIVAVRDQRDQLIGAAPLMRSVSLASGRVLSLLGSGKACTDYLTITSAPGREAEVVEAVANWLHMSSTDAADGWDLLHLDNAPAADSRWRRLIEVLCEQGSDLHGSEALQCWRIPKLNDWDTYLSRLSKSHRKQIRRILKRELAEPRFEVRRADFTSFDIGWDALVELHQRRWASRGVDGCFSDPRFSGFLLDAANGFLEDRQLDLWWLEESGRPVAAQIDFRGQAGAFSYQAGIDPGVSGYGPGQLLQIAVLKHAAEAQVERYDFLRGDEGYKAHWRAEPMACESLRITPPTASARIRSGAWSAGQTLKAWIKTGLGMDRNQTETSA